LKVFFVTVIVFIVNCFPLLSYATNPYRIVLDTTTSLGVPILLVIALLTASRVISRSSSVLARESSLPALGLSLD